MPLGKCIKPNKELADGCVLKYVPTDRVVRDRRGFGLVSPDLVERQYGMHEHTVMAEVQTICNRHLFKTPDPELNSEAWKLFDRRMHWISRMIGVVPMAPIASLLVGRSGRRRSRFWLGIQRYHLNGIRKADSRITEMQKLEFYEVSKMMEKEDRGIQYRSVQYNVALARHLHNIEERLIGLHPYGYRPVMKGATPEQRCVRLLNETVKYRKPLFLLLDHSRFDAHVNLPLLKAEHGVYMRCRRRHPELRKLLTWQRANVGRSEGGVIYTTRGKRMSGDCNTSLGNTLLNMAMLYAWLDCSNVRGSVFLDGDDSVVIIEEDDRTKLVNVQEFMLKLGMETECELTNDFWKVEFCQSRPCNLNGRITFVRDPIKVLATFGRMPQSVEVRDAKDIVRASAMCEIAMSPGCPVIQPMMIRVLDRLGNGRIQVGANWDWKYVQYGVDVKGCAPSEIDWRARYTFAKAWGIDPGMQDLMEEQSLTWNWGEGVTRNKTPKTREQPYEVEDLGLVMPKCECGDCPKDIILDESLRFWGL